MRGHKRGALFPSSHPVRPAAVGQVRLEIGHDLVVLEFVQLLQRVVLPVVIIVIVVVVVARVLPVHRELAMNLIA